MAPYTQNQKVLPGRVRVTKRIMSEPDHRGFQTLVAREGEEISLSEAVRRGIPEKHLEAVGHGGELALTDFKKAVKGARDDAARIAAAAEAEAAARQAELDDIRRRDAAIGTAGAPAGGPFPQARGGGKWLLSNGETITATEEEAHEAQAELAAGGAAGDGAPATGPFPQARAGGKWLLSSGHTILGTEEEAKAAQDELDEQTSTAEVNVDELIKGNVDDVLGRVGDDRDLAARVLEAERSARNRSTLTGPLEELTADGGDDQSGGQ